MIDRDYMIQRLSSKPMTIEEFNFESMIAPPISSMFTQEDIINLNYIASSPKYSSKLDEKYKLINNIMENRGFKKYVAGTNRVSYIPIDPVLENIFIVKIPYTRAAMEDNIREYRNQFFIKPFCTKVFEVTPCGTIGLFEKVRPITHTDEYLSIADDIYELLSEFLIGEYVIDDIGTNYFMNIGVRRGFGPVLLDFPYVYKVDPKRLYCCAKDENSPTGYCNGEIDYDPGFNYLYCTKCNCKYKPYELGQRIQYEQKIIKGKGELDMKLTIIGGSKNRNEEIVTGDFRNPVNSIKSNLLNKRVEKAEAEEKAAESSTDDKIKTVNGISAAKKDEDVEVEVREEETEVEKSEEEKELSSPFVIDESLKDSKEDPGYVEENGEEEEEEEPKDVGRYLAKIVHIYYYGEKDDDEKESIVKNLAEYLVDIFADNIEEALKMFSAIIKKKKNIKDEITKDFLDTTSCSFKDQILKLLFKNDEYNIDINVDEVKGIYSDDLIEEVPFEANIKKKKNDQIVAKYEGTTDIHLNLEEDPDVPEENYGDSDSIDENPEEADGIRYYKISIVDKKALFPDLDSGKVIVLKDNNGNYLVKDKSIVGANKIGENNIGDVEVISKDWVNNAKKMIKNMKQAPVGSLPENKDEEVDKEE